MVLFGPQAEKAIRAYVGQRRQGFLVTRDSSLVVVDSPQAKKWIGKIPGQGELAILIDAFNEMLGQIDKSERALRKAHGELE